jgi:hypothetical protein
MQVFQNYNDASPTHQYLDIQATNINQSGDLSYPILQINDTRNSPILNNIKEYYMSVVRFELDTARTLPFTIPEVVLGQNNPNLLNYKIMVRHIATETLYSNNMIYSPSDSAIPAPTTIPTNNTDLVNPYYYVYSMQHWVRMLNHALSVSCTSAWQAHQVGAVQKAFFEYIPESGLLNLYVPTAYANIFTIHVDNNLGVLLDGFDMTYNENVGAPTVQWNEINFYSTIVNELSINSVDYYKMTQMTSSIGVINAVRGIEFAVSMLAVNPTMINPCTVFGDNIRSLNNGNNSQIGNIMSDFSISMSPTNQYKPNVGYTPSAELRLFDLVANMSQSQITITVYWKDRFGINHPIRLAPSCTVNIKILFRKKSFNGI